MCTPWVRARTFWPSLFHSTGKTQVPIPVSPFGGTTAGSSLSENFRLAGMMRIPGAFTIPISFKFGGLFRASLKLGSLLI